MNAGSLVSIIIPCYNQAEYLRAAVESIINQTHSNWECIIINDGSTDNTSIVARQICSADERIKYFYKKNGGLSSARNEGLRKAEGTFIQFLDADDLLEKDKLERAISVLTGNPFCNLVICDFVRCNFDDTIRKPPYCDLSTIDFNFENILLNWDKTFTIPIHCGLFKSALLEKYQFKEDVGAKEDWLMWLYIFSASPDVIFINSPLAIYREHQNSMSANRPFMYENTAKAFAFIMNNVVPEKYKHEFFEKINCYWKDEVQFLQLHISNYQTNEKKMYQSRSYKLVKLLLSPFNYVNNNLFNLFRKSSSKINF